VFPGAVNLNRRCRRTNRIDADFNSAAVSALIAFTHADGHQVSVVEFEVLDEVLANHHRAGLHKNFVFIRIPLHAGIARHHRQSEFICFQKFARLG